MIKMAIFDVDGICELIEIYDAIGTAAAIFVVDALSAEDIIRFDVVRLAVLHVQLIKVLRCIEVLHDTMTESLIWDSPGEAKIGTVRLVLWPIAAITVAQRTF